MKMKMRKKMKILKKTKKKKKFLKMIIIVNLKGVLMNVINVQKKKKKWIMNQNWNYGIGIKYNKITNKKRFKKNYQM